jgi:hypothetical protein
MALATQFSKELENLFKTRTAWLRVAIGKKRPGPVPAFTKKKVKRAVDKLVATARQIIVKERARGEFDGAVTDKRQWHVRNKGWGVLAKRESFKRWYKKHIHGQNCVYVFWSGRKCKYVGRTLSGKGRPSSWFDKYWFGGVTRIDIYPVKNPTIVPKAECLAIDLFEPRRNEISPARPKYAKQCPICAAEKEIRRELNSIFALRRKKKRRAK